MGYRKVCFASSAPLLHQYFAEPRVWIEVLKLYHETFSSLKWFTLMETDTSLILKLIPLPALTKIFSRKKLTPLNYTKLIKWMQQNFMTVCYHVTYEFQSNIHNLYLPECQGTPSSKQARYLKFKWLQSRCSHWTQVPLQISTHKTAQSFGQFGQI